VMLRDMAKLPYIRNIDRDFLLVTTRGRRRGTWAIGKLLWPTPW
jgi:hypothetical protein